MNKITVNCLLIVTLASYPGPWAGLTSFKAEKYSDLEEVARMHESPPVSTQQGVQGYTFSMDRCVDEQSQWEQKTDSNRTVTTVRWRRLFKETVGGFATAPVHRLECRVFSTRRIAV